MSVFFFCRVRKLWKMLVEHSALWRHESDTLQGMYVWTVFGKMLEGVCFIWMQRITKNPSWPSQSIYGGLVTLRYYSGALNSNHSTLRFKLKAVHFSPLIIRMFGYCRLGFSSGDTWDQGSYQLVWDATHSVGAEAEI